MHRTHGTTTTEPEAMGPGRERRKALFYPQTLPTTTTLLYSTHLLSLSSQKLVDPTAAAAVTTTPHDRHEPLLLYIFIYSTTHYLHPCVVVYVCENACV